MGKAKRNRVKSRGNNPIGIPSIRDIEREETEFGVNGEDDHMSTQESTLQVLFELLQSANAEDKVIGLQTLATIFDAPGSIEDVMKHKVVKVAAPLLFDKSSAVMNAAAVALRNLSASGSLEICDMLVEQDVMTPLTALLQKYSVNWEPNKTRTGIMDELTDTFTQAVHLLWNLCGSNSTAIKYFNDSNLLPVLMKCLEVEIFGINTVIAVAQCLHTVTEDNPQAISKLQESKHFLHKLLELEDNEPAILLLRTLACGLLLNLNYNKVSNLTPTSVTQLMCNLSATLNVDHRKALNDFTSSLPLEEDIETSAHYVQIQKDITTTLYFLDAQQSAIELLTNICSSDDIEDDTMEQDCSDNSSDEIMSDCGLIEEDVSTVEKFSLNVPTEVHEAIVSYQFVQKIWDRSQLPAENVCQILKEHTDGKHLFKKLCTLRCRALLCLNNLISGLDIEDLGGPNNLYQIWLNICTHVFKNADLDDIKFLEAATSALRATLQKLAEVQQCNMFGHLLESDLQLMFDVEQKCKDENVRTNLIRSIGTLGMILTNSTEVNSHPLLKSVGKFLLDVCGREQELWIIAEALDTIMDVFGEDETDLAAAEIHLVEKLKALLSPLKHKVRLQRKSLGDHYLIVTTVNANLSRFIKYKSERVSRLHQTNGHTV